MGSRISLDRCGKYRPHLNSIPGPSSPYRPIQINPNFCLFSGAGVQQKTVNGPLTQDGPCGGHVAGEHSVTGVSGTITTVKFVDNLESSVLVFGLPSRHIDFPFSRGFLMHPPCCCMKCVQEL